MRTILFRLAVIAAVCLTVVLISATPSSQAQTQPCPPEVGCIDLTLLPNTLVGDVLVDGAPVAGQVNTVRLNVAPNVPHQIDVSNFNDATPGFNDLFNYNPASQKNVTVGAGKTKAVTLKPAINYLKGFVKFTCDIKGVEAGQTVACQPNVDGNPLPPVNPRESAQFAIANGDHNFHVDLVGPNADLWAPPNADKPIKITGNRTTPLTMSFNRKGQLVINVGPQGTVADLFVDDQPIAGQAPTGSIFVAPGSHKVEGRNFTDPAANGVYRWADVASTGTVGPNQTRSITLNPKKEFLLGFAEVTCKINGVEAGQDVRCNVAVDGQGLGTIETGQKQTYNLAPGPHTMNVAVVGGNADLWAPAAQDLPMTITAGRSSRVTPTFNRKGQLVISLAPQGTVADLFVDDQPIAGQAPTGSIFVAPGSHKVEGRNFTDPAANGVYRWADVASTGTVGPNQTRPITLNPKKEFLLGFADATCKINGLEAGQDVRCNVTVDGQGLGTIEAGQKQTYNLTPGPHTMNVAVVGGNADLWAPTAQDLPMTITAGKSSRVTPTFNRKGILNITLSDPKVVADIFVDGAQVASQVNSTQVPVAPNTAHVVEARGLINTTAPDAFEYDPISSKVTVAANQTKAAPLKVGTPREKCTESMAYMQIYNFIRSTLTLTFEGPEQFKVRVPANGNIMVCFVPGTYTVSSSAPGYKFKSDTHDFQAGGCYWSVHYRENETPPEVNCSLNHGEYKRPVAFK